MPSASVVCHRCGTTFQTYPSQAMTRKYCGKECRLAALADYAKEHNHLNGYIAQRTAGLAARRKKTLALRKTGKTCSEIAAQVGISRQRVQQIIKSQPTPEFDGTLAQFLALTRATYPGCRICEDGDGQIVIYTGATTEMGGQVVQWEPDDEDRYREWCERNPEVK